jgi:hypothetical protein
MIAIGAASVDARFSVVHTLRSRDEAGADAKTQARNGT